MGLALLLELIGNAMALSISGMFAQNLPTTQFALIYLAIISLLLWCR
jgi:uncharacterized membrane protein YbaN (DUF454 family)